MSNEMNETTKPFPAHKEAILALAAILAVATTGANEHPSLAWIRDRASLGLGMDFEGREEFEAMRALMLKEVATA